MRTGEACRHDLGAGFSPTCAHKDAHMAGVLLSARLTSPALECPSAGTALERRNTPTPQWICERDPPGDYASCSGSNGVGGMSRDVDATP